MLIPVGERGLQTHRIIEQGEVGQHTKAFEHSDPVLVAQLRGLRTQPRAAALESAFLPLARRGVLGETQLLLLLIQKLLLSLEFRGELAVLLRSDHHGAIGNCPELLLHAFPAVMQLCLLVLPPLHGGLDGSFQPAGFAVLRPRGPGAQSLCGFVGHAPPGFIAHLERGEELVQSLLGMFTRIGQQSAQERAGVAGLHDGGRARGIRRTLVPRHAVHEERRVLPVQNFLSGQVRGRGPHPAVEHELGFNERRTLAPSGHEGQVQGVAGQAPSASHALQVGGHGVRDGRQDHGGEITNVDAHFQRGRGHQHVRGARRGLAVLELVLVLQARVRGKQ